MFKTPPDSKGRCHKSVGRIPWVVMFSRNMSDARGSMWPRIMGWTRASLSDREREEMRLGDDLVAAVVGEKEGRRKK